MQREAAEEMTMHKDDEFRTLFGKLYIWGKTPAGNLTLISVERLGREMARVVEPSDA